MGQVCLVSQADGVLGRAGIQVRGKTGCTLFDSPLTWSAEEPISQANIKNMMLYCFAHWAHRDVLEGKLVFENRTPAITALRCIDQVLAENV
jgi:hypothetical protein